MFVHPTTKRLEARLDELGWRKNEFADRCGISTQQYNNWRTRGISVRLIRKAADIIGVSRDWLETGAGNPSIQEPNVEYLTGNTLNRSIMNDVIKVVTEELIMKGKTLPPEKMSELMFLLHDEIREGEQEGKKPDKAKIVKLIKLVA